MSYQVNFLEEKGIVFGKINKTLSFELAIAYLCEASQLAVSNGVKKILTDARSVDIDIDEEGVEILSKSLGELGVTPDLKRAVLIQNSQRLHGLWEDFNLKEGRPNLKLFVEESMAIQWLESDC